MIVSQMENELTIQFRVNLTEAFSISEKALYQCSGQNNFQSFLLNLAAKFPQEKCVESWTTKTLTVRCEDCQLSESSCICANCFLRGDHTGHKYRLVFSVNGNCDCGDSQLFKPSGFCSLHRQTTKNELEPKLKQLFISIFRSAIRNLPYYLTQKRELLIELLNWLQIFTSVSDVFRKLFTFAIAETTGIVSLICLTGKLNHAQSCAFANFLVRLVNDDDFRSYASAEVLNHYPTILQYYFDNAVNDLGGSYKIQSICFHFFSESNVQKLIDEGFDWKSHVISILNIINTFLQLHFQYRWVRQINLHHEFSYLHSIIEVGRRKEEPSIEFIDAIIKFAEQYDLPMVHTRVFGDKVDDKGHTDLTYHSVSSGFLSFAHSLKLQSKTLKIKPLQRLLATFETEDVDYEKSVLDGSKIKLALLLNQLAYIALNDDIELLRETAKGRLERWMYFPVRLFAVSMLCEFDYFIRNADSFNTCAKLLRFGSNVNVSLMPTFALVQTCIALAEDKNRIVRQAAVAFGLFSGEENVAFAFVHFLACVLYDRVCLENNLEKMYENHIMFLLKLGPQEINEIERDCIVDVSSNWDKYSEVVERVDGKLKLKDGVTSWTAVTPVESLINVRHVICNHHDLNAPSFGEFYSLKEVLFSPFFYAIEFFLMSNFSDKEEIFIYVFSFVKSQVELSPGEDIKICSVEAENIDDLANKLPQDFHSFLGCSISIGGKQSNFLDLLINVNRKRVEELGLIDPEPIVVEASPAVDRSKAAERKARLLAQFKQRQGLVDLGDIEDDAIEDEMCSICRSVGTNPIGFPLHHFESILPSLVSGDPPLLIIDFSGCTHPIHFSCVDRVNYACPIDRSWRNAIIPIEPSYDSSLMFMLSIYPSNMPLNISIMRTIEGKIQLLEILQRRQKDAPTRRPIAELMPLFMEAASFVIVNSQTKWAEPFLAIIQRCLQGEDPIDIPPSELLRRQVRLLYFYKRKEKELDLSLPALDAYFGSPTHHSAVVDQPYTLQMEHEFIRMYTEDVKIKGGDVAQCLLTGNLVDMIHDMNGFPGITEHLANVCAETFSVFLDLTSVRASSVFISFFPVGYPIYIPGPYQSVFGVEDPGLEIGQPLFAEKERIEKLTDYILSGEWVEKKMIMLDIPYLFDI